MSISMGMNMNIITSHSVSNRIEGIFLLTGLEALGLCQRKRRGERERGRGGGKGEIVSFCYEHLHPRSFHTYRDSNSSSRAFSESNIVVIQRTPLPPPTHKCPILTGGKEEKKKIESAKTNSPRKQPFYSSQLQVPYASSSSPSTS